MSLNKFVINIMSLESVDQVIVSCLHEPEFEALPLVMVRIDGSLMCLVCSEAVP